MQQTIIIDSYEDFVLEADYLGPETVSKTYIVDLEAYIKQLMKTTNTDTITIKFIKE